MPESAQPEVAQPDTTGQVARRQFLAGVGAAAVALPVGLGGARPAAGPGPASVGGPPPVPASPFPAVPSAATTAAEDRRQMLWQLGLTQPTLPAKAADPNAPPNAFPRNPANPDGNWTDPVGHTVERGAFGQWITYDSDAGAAGGAQAPFGDYGPLSAPRYTDIELLTTRDGTPVRTPEQWWLTRRPEILRDVQDHLYGRIPDRDRWPAVAWTTGPATTGSANGFGYTDRTITGVIDTSGYPQVRNAPTIQAILRTPLDRAGEPVPVIITFGSAASAWPFTAPFGYAVCGFNPAPLQPDSGGANMSSFIIGLINKGNWRSPRDWGALAAWSWGISRLIDWFETEPSVDATRIGAQGHSRFGKATLVAAAYDERIGAAYPSCGGALGTSWARRSWGENLEFVCGSDSEYHWVAGNTMRYAGELHPGSYWPRKVEHLPVDVHSVLALIAPRVVLTNGGTDTPPGFGDAWQDPRGMYLAGAVASQVWTTLGWPGQVIPAGTEFTSGPTESVGGTPPIGATFIDGTVGWRRHAEGHTPTADWPTFMRLTARHFDGHRPVVAPAQHFVLGHGPANVVGTVQASDPDGGTPANWQITGGTGAGRFSINRDSGRITIPHPQQLDLAHRSRYTLTVVADDRKLTSRPATVTIAVPDLVNICHHGRTVAVPKAEAATHLRHGDPIGQFSR